MYSVSYTLLSANRNNKWVCGCVLVWMYVENSIRWDIHCVWPSTPHYYIILFDICCFDFKYSMYILYWLPFNMFESMHACSLYICFKWFLIIGWYFVIRVYCVIVLCVFLWWWYGCIYIFECPIYGSIVHVWCYIW